MDTNQLIDSLMNSFVEKEFSKKEKQQVRNFTSYIVSSWILSERDGFMRNERNNGIKELNSKLQEWNFYPLEKIDRKKY